MYKDIKNLSGENYYDIDAINNSIRNILLTRKGSVPGKPTFGSDLWNIIFEPMNHLTESIAKNIAFEALAEFEPRIRVKDVLFERVEAFNKIILEIVYYYVDNDYQRTKDSASVTFNL